jgi:hypothetical protein
MASIRKEIVIDVRPDEVWDAIRDVGAIHTRLAKGFVTDTRLEGDSRVVTFANGAVVRELIVDVDDEARRLAYAVVEWRAKHHHATFQVFAQGSGSLVVWITDLVPNDLAELVEGLMAQGSAAMKTTLESQVSVRSTV